MKKLAGLCLVFNLFSLLSAASLRTYTFGKVQIAQNNELPSGYFAKAQRYLPGDNISISNPDTGMEINVLNLGTLPESEDVALLLAPEAASRLGIDYSSSLQVKISPRPDNFDEIASGTAVLSYSAVASANNFDSPRRSAENTAPAATSSSDEPEADLSSITHNANDTSGGDALSLIFPPEVLEKLGNAISSSEDGPQKKLEESSGAEIAKISTTDDSDILETIEAMEMAPVESVSPSENGVIIIDNGDKAEKKPRVVKEVKPRDATKKRKAAKSEPAKVEEVVKVVEPEKIEAPEPEHIEEPVYAEEPITLTPPVEIAKAEPSPVPFEAEPPKQEEILERISPDELEPVALHEPVVGEDFFSAPVIDETLTPVVENEENDAPKPYVASGRPEPDTTANTIVEYEEEEYTEETDITLIPTDPFVPEYNPAYAIKEKPKKEKPSVGTTAAKENVAKNELAAKPKPKAKTEPLAPVQAAKKEEPVPVAKTEIKPKRKEDAVASTTVKVPLSSASAASTSTATATTTPVKTSAAVNSNPDIKLVKEENLPMGYYVQIATMSTKSGAGELQKKYKKYPVVVVPTPRGTYKVLVGPLSGDEYGATYSRFKAFGYKDAFIKKVADTD